MVLFRSQESSRASSSLAVGVIRLRHSSFRPSAISSQSSSSSIWWKASSPISSLARMASTAWRAACERARDGACALVSGLAAVAVDRPALRCARCAVNSWRTASATGEPIVRRLARPACSARSRAALHLAADRIVVVQIERAQQGLERQPLDTSVPSTTENAVSTIRSRYGKRRRQRQRRGQRDDAAHAGPRDDQAAADGRPQHRPRRIEAERGGRATGRPR